MRNSTPHLQVVVGLGATGLSVLRHLHRLGFPLAATDDNERPSHLAAIQAEFPDITYRLGGLDRALLESAERIIVSPGISPQHPEIGHCQSLGIPIVGDITLFREVTDAPIVAVTGSNGKSSVVTLLGEMVKAAGLPVGIGGNLGIPALDLLTNAAEPPVWYVLELSSAQLSTNKSVRPFASVILNITPDHLDYHGSWEKYTAAKKRIYEDAGHVVINRQEPLYSELYTMSYGLDEPEEGQWGIREHEGVRMISYGRETILPVSEVLVSGDHQLSNILAAFALGDLMELPRSSMVEAVKRFKGLPHRCRLVKVVNGVSWYNDSKATNIGAAIASIRGLASSYSGRIILLAGGRGKGADFSELAPVIETHVKQVMVYGEDAQRLEAALREVTHLVPAGDLVEAIQKAHEVAEQGDLVLLAPACASWDSFRDYTHRGAVFESTVEALAA